MKLLYIIGTVALICVFFLLNRKNNVEAYTDADNCSSSEATCGNFNECCLNNKDIKCKNPNLVACQKFRIKCENRCQNKKTDDMGNKFNNDNTNMKKCMDICSKVQSDCCRRLNK